MQYLGIVLCFLAFFVGQCEPTPSRPMVIENLEPAPREPVEHRSAVEAIVGGPVQTVVFEPVGPDGSQCWDTIVGGETVISCSVPVSEP